MLLSCVSATMAGDSNSELLTTALRYAVMNLFKKVAMIEFEHLDEKCIFSTTFSYLSQTCSLFIYRFVTFFSQ